MADSRYPNWLRFSGIGFELAGVLAAFTLIGYWIDRRYGTAPWGIVGGVVFGLAGGLYNLIRQSLEATREAAEDDREARREAGLKSGSKDGS
jgi:F0F1-type ATP synthase assembly protein I